MGTLFIFTTGCAVDLIARFFDSMDKTNGGWAALVLVLVIVVIAYLARFVIMRQMEQVKDREADRKAEFEQQLERERMSTGVYQQTTKEMMQVVSTNSAAFNTHAQAMSELTSVIKPMAETLNRIDKHFNE